MVRASSVLFRTGCDDLSFGFGDRPFADVRYSKKWMAPSQLGGRPLPRAEPRKAPSLYPEGPLRRVSHGLNAHRASVERGWSLWVPRQKTERISDPMACGIAGKG